MEPTSGKLRGEVEVDEIIVGGLEPGVIGRQTHTKSKVVVAVERRGPRMAAGRVRMERILRYDSASRIGFIERNVEPGSTIITDAWNAYTRLPQHGYTHIAHNISRSGQQAHELMPAVHRVAALVKRWLLGTHQGAVAPSHLHFYLDEWCFRFNRRRSGHRGLLFHNLVKQAAQTPPQPYTELLTPEAGRRRKSKQAQQRARRAAGDVGDPRNIPRPAPKRPGGARARLSDEAVRRRRVMVSGRRGVRGARKPPVPGSPTA
jgi:transposase-like protein